MTEQQQINQINSDLYAMKKIVAALKEIITIDTKRITNLENSIKNHQNVLNEILSHIKTLAQIDDALNKRIDMLDSND